MPTNLHNPRQSSRERYYARQAVQRLSKQTRFTEILTAPWAGWVPDLPPHLVGWHGYRDGQGLVAMTHGGKGIYLRHDDGFERVDADRLPLGQTMGGHVPGQYATMLLAQYTDAANNPNRIALVAGDGGVGVDIYIARVDPGTGQWAQVAPLAAMTAALGGTNPRDDRDAIYDHCVFPFGAPTRDFARYGDAGYLGINEPCMIFCCANYDSPVGNVYVTPVDSSVANNELYYDTLTRWAPDPGFPFRAASCESFDGRVHFLNTVEDLGGGGYCCPSTTSLDWRRYS